jgi:hypothetical protein
LAGKPERKITLGRSMCRWEDIVKMGVKEVGWSSMDCIDLAQGRDKCWVRVNMVMKILVL